MLIWTKNNKINYEGLNNILQLIGEKKNLCLKKTKYEVRQGLLCRAALTSELVLQLGLSSSFTHFSGGTHVQLNAIKAFKLTLFSVETQSILSNLQSDLTYDIQDATIPFPVTRGKCYLCRGIYLTDFETRWTMHPCGTILSPLITEGVQKTK